jgi:hypothetical protein
MSNERIDKDIDELLWAVAESNDVAQEAEFANRYPHLRGQLATRKAIVEVLRNSKPQGVPFVAFRPPTPVPTRRWWLVPATAVGLAAVAMGSYWKHCPTPRPSNESTSNRFGSKRGFST